MYLIWKRKYLSVTMSKTAPKVETEQQKRWIRYSTSSIYLQACETVETVQTLTMKQNVGSMGWHFLYIIISLFIECFKLYQHKQQCYSQYFQIDKNLDSSCSWVPFSCIYPWTFYPIQTRGDKVKHNRPHQIISTQQPF